MRLLRAGSLDVLNYQIRGGYLIDDFKLINSGPDDEGDGGLTQRCGVQFSIDLFAAAQGFELNIDLMVYPSLHLRGPGQGLTVFWDGF